MNIQINASFIMSDNNNITFPLIPITVTVLKTCFIFLYDEPTRNYGFGHYYFWGSETG